MNQLKLFIDLTRLQKPIGYMLLFWPCAWGLTLAYDFSSNLNNYFFYLILFFLGSVLMRSAGCIVNDIFDKDFVICNQLIENVEQINEKSPYVLVLNSGDIVCKLIIPNRDKLTLVSTNKEYQSYYTAKRWSNWSYD